MRAQRCAARSGLPFDESAALPALRPEAPALLCGRWEDRDGEAGYATMNERYCYDIEAAASAEAGDVMKTTG
jgi:hypothetical protein